jgi:hypothetical protein
MIILLFIVGNIVVWIFVAWLNNTRQKPSDQSELERLRIAAEMFTNRDLYPEKHADEVLEKDMKISELTQYVFELKDEIKHLNGKINNIYSKDSGVHASALQKAMSEYGAAFSCDCHGNLEIRLRSGEKFHARQLVSALMDDLAPIRRRKR